MPMNKKKLSSINRTSVSEEHEDSDRNNAREHLHKAVEQ